MLGERSVMACERSRRNTHEDAALYIVHLLIITEDFNENNKTNK
jgi:hypothetical protein